MSSEADCGSNICCRLPPPAASNMVVNVSTTAPLFGYHKCDSPFYLALAALQSIGPLTGISREIPLALTLYTGDLVAHDPQTQKSHDYLEATEAAVFQMFKAYIGGPVYLALGNHDTSPENEDVPHAIDDSGTLGRQLSWNYEHVTKLWEHHGWIDNRTQAQASSHYAAYSVVHPLGLHIITLNTDLYYRNNPFSFVRAVDPVFSGMFSVLVEQLQVAEDAGQRAWIMGHVLSGWDGANAMPGPSEMLYQIIDRYSPHVIANGFWGPHARRPQSDLLPQQ